jgi:hypothetical protein
MTWWIMPTRVKPPIWRAKFTGVKVNTSGGVVIFDRAVEVELRPSDTRVNLYQVYIVGGLKPLSERNYTLAAATRSAVALFVEQLSEWEVVAPG